MPSVYGLMAMHGIKAMRGLPAWVTRGWHQNAPWWPHMLACRIGSCNLAAMLMLSYLCRIATLTGFVCLLLGWVNQVRESFGRNMTIQD